METRLGYVLSLLMSTTETGRLERYIEQGTTFGDRKKTASITSTLARTKVHIRKKHKRKNK